MKKPQNYTIENGRIFRIRRATAEALANEGFLILSEGSKLDTSHALTPKGVAFFNHTSRGRFSWKEPEPVKVGVSIIKNDDNEAEKPSSIHNSPTLFGLPHGLKKTSDLFRESLNPSSPHYDPATYPDEATEVCA